MLDLVASSGVITDCNLLSTPSLTLSNGGYLKLQKALSRESVWFVSSWLLSEQGGLHDGTNFK